MVLGDLRDDLVEGRVDESVELDLHHRAVAAHRQTDCGADDSGFCQGGANDACVPEILGQPISDAEHATEGADVFP